MDATPVIANANNKKSLFNSSFTKNMYFFQYLLYVFQNDKLHFKKSLIRRLRNLYSRIFIFVSLGVYN